MEYLFGDDFAISPKSFNYPEEEYFLEEHMKRNPSTVYIGKPSKGSGGEGIFLMKKFSDMPKYPSTHELVIQEYIDEPLIVEKKKFDLRLYVFIKGFDPIDAFLYEEGMARFCTVSIMITQGKLQKARER